MGLGMTTVLPNIHQAGFSPPGSLVPARGLFYGGLAQILAAIMGFERGNTFGLTAVTGSGCFWLSLVGILMIPTLGWSEAAAEGFVGCSRGAVFPFLCSWAFWTELLLRRSFSEP